MGTCRAFCNHKRCTTKKYIHQIYMLPIMVIRLPIMGVYIGLELPKEGMGTILDTHTHTQKYINWKSNVPMVTKTGCIKTLIFRAYDLCTEIKNSSQ